MPRPCTHRPSSSPKWGFDDEFHTLDQVFGAAAKAIPGYLGEETWENPSNGVVSYVYYRETREVLQAPMKDPSHLLAKARHAKWLDGYRVVIAEVQREYGVKRLGLTAVP